MKFASLIISLVSVLTLAGLPAHAAQKQTIPFEISDTGHLIIKLGLNDETETDAVFDTGATFPVIHFSTAARAQIALPVEGRLVNILGLGGQKTFPIIDIASAQLGDVVIRNLEAAYNDGTEMPGAKDIFPANQLPHRVLDFNFETGEVSAYDGRPEIVRRATTERLPIRRINKLPFVEIELNGVKALALIDTGANITVVNPAFADILQGRRIEVRTVEVVGATGEVIPLQIAQSRNLDLGEFRFKLFEVLVADPDLLHTLGLNDQPVMVLGLDVLSQFRAQIDREQEQLVLSRAHRGLRLESIRVATRGR